VERKEFLQGIRLPRLRAIRRSYERYAFRDCVWCNGFFLSFREEIVGTFDALFSSTGGEDSGQLGGGETEFSERYGWYQSLYALAQGDALRIESVTQLEVKPALMWLQFEKEKTQLENKRIKRASKR